MTENKFRSQILNICLILCSVTSLAPTKKTMTPVKLGWASVCVSSYAFIPT